MKLTETNGYAERYVSLLYFYYYYFFKLICQVCWDVTTAHECVHVSQDLQRARLPPGYRGLTCSVMGKQPTDDFTVQFVPSASTPERCWGNLLIGFITKDAFNPNGIAAEGTIAGRLCGLRPRRGHVDDGVGTHSYCEGFTEGTVRAVFDREQLAVSFHVNQINVEAFFLPDAVVGEREPVYPFVSFFGSSPHRVDFV